MKRLLLSLALLVSTFSAYSSQKEGEWVVGGKMNLYTGWDGTFGIGAYCRYGITDQLRVEPAAVFLCRTGCSVDLSADLQYAFPIEDSFEIFPLAGISVNDPGNFGVGLCVGGGMNFLTKLDWDFTANVKWMVETQKYIANPVVVSIGAHYKF